MKPNLTDAPGSPVESQISLHSWLFQNKYDNNNLKENSYMAASQISLYPWFFENKNDAKELKENNQMTASQISLYPWLFQNVSDNNDLKERSQMGASLLTLYPWIFEVENPQATISRLGKLKARLGKFGHRILKPFKVLKSCMKSTTDE